MPDAEPTKSESALIGTAVKISAVNPVLLFFASGDSLYPGAALILIAVAISPMGQRGPRVRLRNLTAWLGLVMMAIACPPFT